MEMSTAPLASVHLVLVARLAMIPYAEATSFKVAPDRPFKLPLGHRMEILPLANAKAAGVASAAMVRAPCQFPVLLLGTRAWYSPCE